MFSDEEKAIFGYHDGQRERYADPLVLRRTLIRACDGDLDGLWRAAAEPETREGATPDPGAELARQDAQERFNQAVRKAFELLPFDPATGQGCTEAMVLAVWEKWAGFLRGEGAGTATE